MSPEKTNYNNICSFVDKSYSYLHEGLRPRDPWSVQRKLQQTGEGAGECQHINTGLNQLG